MKQNIWEWEARARQAEAENARLREENARLREALDEATLDGPGYLCSSREYDEYMERRDEYRKALL